MNVGYACQCFTQTIPSFRTCTKRFVSEEKLIDIIAHNLKVLDQILDYNHHHFIHLFRISSDLVPFGSSPINTVDWKTMFAKEFQALGEKARAYDIRLTMHPGQYTILNTPDPMVWERSVLDLRYHCDILNLMEMDQTSKLILHIGGIYGDKQAAMKRFLTSFPKLDEDIQARLIIENDDRYYTLEDVCLLSKKLDIPVIFDNLHHDVLPSFPNQSLDEILSMVQRTWNKRDGRMKIHYSQQNPQKRKGAHASNLNPTAFLTFCEQIHDRDIDVMLEIKSKNLAALQAIDLLYPERFSPRQVWKRYRYLVLSHSISIFTQLEQEHCHMSVDLFYERIYQALMTPCDDILCYRFILQEHRTILTHTQLGKLEQALLRYQKHTLSKQGVHNVFSRVLRALDHEEDVLFL